MNKKSERKPTIDEVFAALDAARIPDDLFRSRSARMDERERLFLRLSKQPALNLGRLDRDELYEDPKNATLEARGRITLPKAVREHMHLKPGDRIEFVLLPVGVLMRRIT